MGLLDNINEQINSAEDIETITTKNIEKFFGPSVIDVYDWNKYLNLYTDQYTTEPELYVYSCFGLDKRIRNKIKVQYELWHIKNNKIVYNRLWPIKMVAENMVIYGEHNTLQIKYIHSANDPIKYKYIAMNGISLVQYRENFRECNENDAMYHWAESQYKRMKTIYAENFIEDVVYPSEINIIDWSGTGILDKVEYTNNIKLINEINLYRNYNLNNLNTGNINNITPYIYIYNIFNCFNSLKHINNINVYGSACLDNCHNLSCGLIKLNIDVSQLSYLYQDGVFDISYTWNGNQYVLSNKELEDGKFKGRPEYSAFKEYFKNFFENNPEVIDVMIQTHYSYSFFGENDYEYISIKQILYA